ncbi:DEAD/DEAH box helicase [Paenibacillus eucommiae]|uniref:SNF2 family DNA or RNA helicase n=1 Tax=Paenibacillus eucommiae TaxID=1355755 RepID=A0ABS4IU99_9BACL|nr:DEAD/DEAH box helicase [Paenibacillus eucommiae]MBP1991155.1 SNF2 family DNA or RNA helicase [Paenibacillus eucommiae]
MSALSTITLQSTRLPSGSFGIWATTEQGEVVSIHELKKQGFAWHWKSFFGTMLLDITEVDGGQALILTPSMALDYFSQPASLLHGTLNWSAESLLLKELAVIYAAALSEGWFAPSFTDWQKGTVGWKLMLPGEMAQAYEALLMQAENQGAAYAKEWFAEIIAEMTVQQEEVMSAWNQLLVEQPVLVPGQESSMEERLWWDEEDWLMAIGWKTDGVPFRTCLQLVEPEEQEEWGLRLILQDKQNPNQLVEFDSNDSLALRSGTFPQHWREHIQERISKDLDKCIRVLPSLESAGQSGSIRMELSDDEAWEFMDQGSLGLLQAGISVFLPTWWEELKLMRPQLKAKIKSAVGSASGRTLFGMQQLMEFDWKIAIGDMDLTEEEFMRMADEKKRLMYIRGKWIQLDPAFLAQIQAAMKQFQRKKGLSFRDVLEAHLLGEAGTLSGGTEADTLGQDAPDIAASLRIQVELNGHLRSMMKQLQQTSGITVVDPPELLHAELRKYQLEGVSWLLYLRKFGLGGCLADDMGLGKTIQFIAYLLHSRGDAIKGKVAVDASASASARAKQSPALLICPTSVLGNWQKELERFAPSLKLHLHYGAQRARGEQFAFAEAIGDADLVMTSYNLAQIDEEELSAVEWDVVCLDEAQNIKNAYTKQASAIRKLNAGQRIALTGTPIENRLTELWSIFDFINPGYLGSLRQFTHNFVGAIEKTGDAELTSQVQKLIKPFLLRRVKKDPAIQLDLPDKNEAKAYVPLTVEQGTLYENIVQSLMERIDSLTGMEKKGLILATLTKLKQLCDHPALFLKETGRICEKERSNKMSRLLEMIDELRAEGDSCLIFTQFVEMGHLLQAAITEERNEPVQFLHGGLTKNKRDELITRFQDRTLPQEEQCSIFILSLKAGGTGLNLTAANHVFHFDRWWNPAVENQATDRAFRIGQTRDVQVHKFISLGTLEERIDEMIERKQGLSEQIVGGGEGWVTEMSTSELRELFALRKEWIDK